MNFIGIAIAIVSSSLSSCHAFAPNRVSTSTALYAETLEGWKIDGLVKPVNNFILIEKAEEQSASDGGILLSKSATIKRTQGKVVSVGPGTPHPDSGIPYPMPVVPGDNVVYGKYDGTEIKVDKVTQTLIRDSDILIKFSGDELNLDTIEVVNDGILVSVQTKEASTSSGLILSTGGDEKRPSTGEVVKVGPGRMAESGELMPMNVEVGDFVKFIDFAGNEVKIGDDEFSMVKMCEVLAKF